MPNYIEIILTTKSFLDEFLTEEKPKILVGKQTENITEFLDQIAAIQNINYEIFPNLPILVKDVSVILTSQFGCTANHKNLNYFNAKKTIKSLSTEDLKDDLKNIDIKPDIIFEIELQSFWDNYSRRRYQEGFLKDHINNKSLYEQVRKTFNSSTGFILGKPGCGKGFHTGKN